MKITKTYYDGCRWCNSIGIISNPEFNPNVTGSTWTIVCPVCKGSKVVLVEEITESDELIYGTPETTNG